LLESRSQFVQEKLHFIFFRDYGLGAKIPDALVDGSNFHPQSPINRTGNFASVEYRILVEKQNGIGAEKTLQECLLKNPGEALCWLGASTHRGCARDILLDPAI
jgi:hypothetical protein